MFKILHSGSPIPGSTGPASAFVGVSDLFKIGIGPSSSHTIGPMKAAGLFRRNLGEHCANTASIVATVFGSLAWTGIGHSTDKAILLGLAGETPDSIDPDRAKTLAQEIQTTRQITLPDGRAIALIPERDVVFDRTRTF